MAEEGRGFTESTNYSTISMKHTNGQLTIIDVVVVQAMSRKVVISDPNIMQLHCPTSLAMSKRWEHVYDNSFKIYICNI